MDLSTGCLEAVDRGESRVGLSSALLGEVEIFKITGDRAFDLFEVALDAGGDPEDFFAVSRDERGDFNVGLKLLIADAPAGDVPAVQAVVASGDCRFLVFDGVADGHFVDPLVVVEKKRRSGGGGGCSVGNIIPGLVLVMVPIILIKKGE